MIKPDCHAADFLIKFKQGKIKKGLGIGCSELDDCLRYKQGNFNIIIGKEGAGKTTWLLWYFLKLAEHNASHNMKFLIFAAENTSEELILQMIQFYTGKSINILSESEILAADGYLSQIFKFIDNKRPYSFIDLAIIARDSECQTLYVDPYNRLINKGNSWEAMLDNLKNIDSFKKKYGITVYLSVHAKTEAAARRYPAGHQYEGFFMPISSIGSEGGQRFPAAADDFISVHRLSGHPSMKFKTQVYIEKVKSKITGGEERRIESEDPILFDYNFGNGFIHQDLEYIEGAQVLESVDFE